MIKVYTKHRHILKIHNYLDSLNLEHEIFTTNDLDTETSFELGVSYCYPKKILNELLIIPKLGFINYHPGPLPQYKGPNEYDEAIKNKEMHWGVTVHDMSEEYDSGKIREILEFDLHEPPTSVEELGAISHYFRFNLFKKTIKNFIK